MSAAEKCLETLLTEGFTLDQISSSVEMISDKYQESKTVGNKFNNKNENVKKVRYYDTL